MCVLGLVLFFPEIVATSALFYNVATFAGYRHSSPLELCELERMAFMANVERVGRVGRIERVERVGSCIWTNVTRSTLRAIYTHRNDALFT